jgi:hypothetical protein
MEKWKEFHYRNSKDKVKRAATQHGFLEISKIVMARKSTENFLSEDM